MAIENDVVLIYLEKSPIFFARVESIWPDVKRDWFNIELLLLQVPLKVLIWTLKDDYINGDEFFMGGKKMRIEVVEAPADTFEAEDLESDEAGMGEPGKKKSDSNSSGIFKLRGISSKSSNPVLKNNPGRKHDPVGKNPEQKIDQNAQIIFFADLQKKRK